MMQKNQPLAYFNNPIITYELNNNYPVPLI